MHVRANRLKDGRTAMAFCENYRDGRRTRTRTVERIGCVEDFLECDGSLVKYDLAPGQSMIVDTGNVLGFTEGVDLDIQKVQGVANVLFGGEGLFNTKLTGPGTIYLQTMPLAGIVDVIATHLPKND